MRGSLSLVFIYIAYSSASERIIGGYKARDAEFPYQLSLLLHDQHICGATILSEDAGVTAAHCFAATGVYSVRAGSTKLGSGGVEVRIAKALVHPYHKSFNQDYDIAIIKFATPLKFSPKIQPVKLPALNEPIPEGVKGYTTGWGSVSVIFPGAMEDLRAVLLPVLPISYCQRRYDMVRWTDRMFCAGFQEGGRDSCTGDSGGPFVINGKLYGIVSWGFSCAEPGYPGVYTNVPILRQYIRSNAGL